MQQTDQPTGTEVSCPVDDATCDLLQALTSKLEAIEAYQMYAEDDGVRELFERLGQEERQHAEQLLAALRDGWPSGSRAGWAPSYRRPACNAHVTVLQCQPPRPAGQPRDNPVLPARRETRGRHLPRHRRLPTWQ